MKFEYKMLERVYPVSESELDALGSLGWELVGMVLMELSSRITDKELVIITTPETYREIPNWHNGSTILKDYKFIMVINGEEPPYGLPDNVSLVYVPTIRMCSTCIRNRVKDGVGIKPFVRDDVYEIIKQYKLYV